MHIAVMVRRTITSMMTRVMLANDADTYELKCWDNIRVAVGYCYDYSLDYNFFSFLLP